MQIICDSFNNFFVNIGPNLANSIKPSNDISYSSYLKKVITSRFNFKLVDVDNINKMIKSLKNKDSSGYDGLSTKLLKLLAPSILPSLTLIINQSLLFRYFSR